MRDETQRTIFPECKFYFRYVLIVLINGFLITFQGYRYYDGDSMSEVYFLKVHLTLFIIFV